MPAIRKKISGHTLRLLRRGLCAGNLLAVFAFFPYCVFAQMSSTPQAIAAPASSTETIKTITRLVEVGVVVTDPKGHPVKGLAQEDFSVEEDKKLQTVHSFEVQTAISRAANTAPQVSLPANTFVNLSAAEEPSTPTVILYDALNTSPNDQVYGQQEILKFIAHHRSGTEIAIFVLSDSLHLVQGFSETPSATPQIQKVIQHFADVDHWNRARLVERRVPITLGALTEVGRFLGGLPGRKNLIWYSSGFPENVFHGAMMAGPGGGGSGAVYSDNYSEQVRQATDLINLSHVAIYPIDIHGVRAPPGFSTAYRGPSGPYAFSTLAARQSFLNFDTAVRATMDSLADDTGGHAFYGTNDLEEALEQAVTAGSTYYSLSYAPTNRNYDGKLRHIKVTLKKPGYTLAYRRTYFADDLDAVARSVVDAPPSPLLSALERGTPLAHGLFVEVHLDAAGAPVPATPEQMQVLAQYQAMRTKQKVPTAISPVMMQQYVVSYGLVARQLEVLADESGVRQASLEFGVIAYDEDGRKLNGLDTHVDDKIPAGRFAKLADEGYRATQPIFVPVTTASLRLAVRDVKGKRVGSIEVKLPLVKTAQAKVE